MATIPPYYDGMFRDGYQPHEILEAAHNSIINEVNARQAERDAAAEPAPLNVHFQVEVKKK
jgi:hypothetical protein